MDETKQTSIQKMIAALWQRSQPQVLERLALLDRAATEPLKPRLRQDAVATAHKLAGTLGMFGFHEGTRLAREFEQHLETPSPDPAHLAALATELRLMPNERANRRKRPVSGTRHRRLRLPGLK